MRLRSGFALGLLALLVAACAERPVTPPVVTPPKTPETPPVYLPTPVPEGARLSDLPGWENTDPFIAIEALRATCQYKKGRQYAPVCADMARQDFETPQQIMAFLNVHFRVEKVEGQGLLTGYFVPDYDAQLTRDAEFSQPVRTKPADLVYVPGSQMTPASSAPKVAARRLGDLYVPYFTRAEIEQLPATAQYYMRPEDYFFMQLQGSGFLDLPDGKRVYAAYAADNGWPFVGIAKTLTERGILDKTQTSGDNIHAWLAAHRGPEATEIMNANPRYGFFAIQPDQTEPVGASGLALPSGSAIAIDPTQNDMGDLFWIDADAGALKDSFPAYQRMVAALDTGGAIKGKIRADLYVGHGQHAGSEAGRIKHTLRMWRLVPYTGG
ncbi:MltA domain-containing protein [Asticcacaulis taihuensis]|uniref:peptidoglycan lytic exotransglycosylase n=1 Tax=Asticcacaulis taihuensis TaxID=260084 RepID=A0A1G4T2K2_9CAUL|nr:MltA domain-containing protein [Asticcacaulis taihuensis]SCW75045.1 membrane-bound lytic murein transglycosylase A [Asticcacaulis taihuensis]